MNVVFRTKDRQLERILQMTAHGRKQAVRTQCIDWAGRSLPAGSPVSSLDQCPAQTVKTQPRQQRPKLHIAMERKKERTGSSKEPLSILSRDTRFLKICKSMGILLKPPIILKVTVNPLSIALANLEHADEN